MNNYLEVLWWLDKSHNVPMDIIRFILSEWISYRAIENNDQFRKNIVLWFTKKEEKQEERNNMIKKYGHISDWNTKNITNMRGAFTHAAFNEDISRWDVSNVEDMSFMFYYCKYFNCDISKWNVMNVHTYRNMFGYCENLIYFPKIKEQWPRINYRIDFECKYFYNYQKVKY